MVYEESNELGMGKGSFKQDVLAMATVNRQQWREVYKHDYGFNRGTIFAELDKPWLGYNTRREMKGGNRK
ncbi:MAG: spore coat associated protein CotJA [Oscillospiraceae bacterium]|nr:spore coat associated protein CotJA [Oscillospiraceae bacterium]